MAEVIISSYYTLTHSSREKLEISINNLNILILCHFRL